MRLEIKSTGPILAMSFAGILSPAMTIVTLTNRSGFSAPILGPLFVGSLLFSTTIAIWRAVITEFVKAEIKDDKLILQNLITRKLQTINLEQIVGYRDRFFGGYYSTSVIDRNNNTVVILQAKYYSNFDEFNNNLNLNITDVDLYIGDFTIQ